MSMNLCPQPSQFSIIQVFLNRQSIVVFAAVLLLACLAIAPVVAAREESILWKLDTTSPHAPGCKLTYARPNESGGHPGLVFDTRQQASEWNTCVGLPAGLLKSGQDYVVTVSYEIIDRSDPDAMFYVFARSPRSGNGADHWTKWTGGAGNRGVARLHITPIVDDYGICAGIRKRGAMRILSMNIEAGSGYTQLPLTIDRNINRRLGADSPDSSGSTQAIGAVEFAVNPPANTMGPVLNLADFGVVPDETDFDTSKGSTGASRAKGFNVSADSGADAAGSPVPSAAADKNLVAFKKAVDECRKSRASKLTIPKGTYRFTSGNTIKFEDLSDFVFDGNGSTFIFDQIKGGAGLQINKCTRTVFTNFNVDWDWDKDPLGWVGRITKTTPDNSSFEMRFDTLAPLDPKRWVTMNPLDEKLRAPGAGKELGGLDPKKVEKIDANTVRVWPSHSLPVVQGKLYLLRHYISDKHCILMSNNAHLLLRNVNVFSFPGIAFIVGGDQHHFELSHCRIAYPESGKRCITSTSDGFHVDQSQGFIKVEDCDFSHMGDDCVNIHDNIHGGVQRLDDHTLIAKNLIAWRCPFNVGDPVEIRNGDFSPTKFRGVLEDVKPDYKLKQVTLVFKNELPKVVPDDSILFNHRYKSHNFIIRNNYFHENRARGILCNTADGLIENNRFFHNQASAVLCLAEVDKSWSEGFYAQNIIFRKNEFSEENSCGSVDGSAVFIGADHLGKAVQYPLLTNIVFEGNSFKETTGPAFFARSFKNLEIRNNEITNSLPPPTELKMRGGIRVELGDGLTVEGNSWTDIGGEGEPALWYEADTVKDIVCKGNHLSHK